MNRILPLLACCLVLWGCSPAAPAGAGVQETQAPLRQAAPLKPQTYYDGALQVFSPGLTSPTGLYAMGEDLLIFSGEAATTLTLLSGDSLTPLSSVTLSFHLSPTDPSLVIASGALSCYDPIKRETLVLDSALREVSHIPAPEGLQGTPILSSDRNTLYYCTSEGIRAWGLETGLHRRIKEMSFPGQSLTGLFFHDTVLKCSIPEDTQTRTTLLSAQTGALLFEEKGDILLTGEREWYCAALSTPLNETLLCGQSPQSPMLFLPENPNAQCYFLKNHPGAVTWVIQGDTRLSYYDLQSGRRTSSLTLGSDLTPIAVTDTPSGAVYLLTGGPSACFLCRWEIAPDNALAVQEETSYLYPCQEDPAALVQCQACASRLSETFGIRILIGDAAVRAQPQDFHLEAETQPGILLRELQDLEERLSAFPSALLTQTASHFTSLNLCIVRSVTGTAASGSQESATGVQFLDGADAYIVITAGKYAEQALYHELFHAMQTHILINSSAFDQWDKLNPQDFSYTYGAPPEESALWLTGENQVILDYTSQVSPLEDRCRIFETALLPGQEETFRPWILQRKLTAVCKGIREAYGLTKSPSVYPWEQYLDASLAYKD